MTTSIRNWHGGPQSLEDDFLSLLFYDNYAELRNFLQDNKGTFDVNYNNGYFLELTMKRHSKIAKILIDHGANVTPQVIERYICDISSIRSNGTTFTYFEYLGIDIEPYHNAIFEIGFYRGCNYLVDYMLDNEYITPTNFIFRPNESPKHYSNLNKKLYDNIVFPYPYVTHLEMKTDIDNLDRVHKMGFDGLEDVLHSSVFGKMAYSTTCIEELIVKKKKEMIKKVLKSS